MAINQEARLSFNIASKWSNRFSIAKLPQGVRIAFAEAAPGENKAYDFHSAVVMTPEDATALAHGLLKVVGAEKKKN